VVAIRTASLSRTALIGVASLGALLLSSPASAGLYKCALDNGGVIYQQEPCHPGMELRDFDRDPATVSVIPFRMVPGVGTSKQAADSPPERRENSRRKSNRPAVIKGNPAERKFLVPGISQGEVVARVGSPDMTTGSGRKTTRWVYLPAPEDPSTITTLSFESGRLVAVERKVVRP
jgi:hypothetical protein